MPGQGYLSQGPLTQHVQLKVQPLEVVLGDSQIVSASGSTITVDCGQTISSIKGVLFVDDSAATVAPVTVANQVIATNLVTLTLTAPMAVNDSVTIYFVAKAVQNA